MNHLFCLDANIFTTFGALCRKCQRDGHHQEWPSTSWTVHNASNWWHSQPSILRSHDTITGFFRRRYRWRRWLLREPSMKGSTRTKDSEIQRTFITIIYRSGQSSSAPTISVILARTLTSEEWRIVLMLKKHSNSNQKSWSVESAPRTPSVLEQRSVRSMEPTLLSLSANSAVPSLNGSAGETPISVILATRSNVPEITCPVKRPVNYRNALELVNVHWKSSTRQMDRNFL